MGPLGFITSMNPSLATPKTSLRESTQPLSIGPDARHDAGACLLLAIRGSSSLRVSLYGARHISGKFFQSLINLRALLVRIHHRCMHVAVAASQRALTAFTELARAIRRQLATKTRWLPVANEVI